MRLNVKHLLRKLYLILSPKSKNFSQKKLSFIPAKEIDLLIWGCNEFSSHLCKLLEASNANIVAFIDNNTDNAEFCGKPVYDLQQFKTNKALDQIPIVIATQHNMNSGIPSVDFESIRQFKIKLIEIVNEHKINNPLLHPAAMADFIDYDYPNRIIAFGTQGAGNTIYNHIFIKLNEAYHRKFKTRNDDAHFIETMCYEYEQCIKQIISDTIYSMGGHNIMSGPWKISTTIIEFIAGKDKIYIHAFPTRDHITHRAYGYHTIPSMGYIDKLKLNQFILYFLIRNPLDIIVSRLNKHNSINKTTSHIDPAVFCYISRRVIDQLDYWTPNLSRLEVLRYEDLMINPIQNISNIMTQLTLKPSKSLAKTIWDQLGFKQLPHAPKKHFTGGGTGKWEKYFKNEHLSYLKKHGMEKVLEKYGYHDELERFRNLCSSISQDEWEGQTYDHHYTLDSCTLDEDQNTFQYLQAIYGKDNCIECGNLYISSKNPDLLAKAKRAFENEYVQKIVLAGSHPAHRLV